MFMPGGGGLVKTHEINIKQEKRLTFTIYFVQ